jgi:hypothetical protein
MTSEKARENRLRRAAARQGYRLEKSRMRDKRGLGHGTFRLVDARTGRAVHGDRRSGYGLTLDDVAARLGEGAD